MRNVNKRSRIRACQRRRAEWGCMRLMRNIKSRLCFYIIWCCVITVSLPQLLQSLFVLMNMLIFVTLHVLLHLQVKAISDNVWFQSLRTVGLLLVSFMFVETVLILLLMCLYTVVCFYLFLWSAFICEINLYIKSRRKFVALRCSMPKRPVCDLETGVNWWWEEIDQCR